MRCFPSFHLRAQADSNHLNQDFSLCLIIEIERDSGSAISAFLYWQAPASLLLLNVKTLSKVAREVLKLSFAIRVYILNRSLAVLKLEEPLVYVLHSLKAAANPALNSAALNQLQRLPLPFKTN